MTLQIFIPTRGRWDHVKTYANLPQSLQRAATLVVDHGERAKYAAAQPQAKIWALPERVRGIAAIRQHILEEHARCCRYLVMLDDDLNFQIRKKGKAYPAKNYIVNSTPAQVEAAFAQLHRWLEDGVVHCGMSTRSIGYNNPNKFITNFRMMHVLAYDVKKVLKAGCSFTKNVPAAFSMDDFHMTLQLLRAGFENRVSLQYVSNPAASNAKGGASEWRTLETHNASARKLAELHSQFVAVKQKSGWRGMDGVRLDVVMQWKKAAASA